MSDYQQSWERAMTPFKPEDFKTKKEVEEAIKALRKSNPDWGLDDEQAKEILTHWESSKND